MMHITVIENRILCASLCTSHGHVAPVEAPSAAAPYSPGVVGATSASSSSEPFSLTGVISVLCFSSVPLLPAAVAVVAN